MMRHPFPLEAPADTYAVDDESTRPRPAQPDAPPTLRTRAGRRGAGPLVLALIAVAWALVLSLLQTEGSTSAAQAAPAPRPIRPIAAAHPHGQPQWPTTEPAETASAYQPATLAFPDGSSAAIYPERVRYPAGRPVKIAVERFDPAGGPMSGVLDMELVVDSPGHEAFKAGFTERTDAPGTYDAIIDADQVGVGRTELAVFASQTAHPGDPIAMASATTIVDVVGGVRFAGPPIAHWQDGQLVIELPVSTQTAAHAVVTATLVAGTDVLGELTGEADLGAGQATVTLGAGELIGADDPRVASLALADGIAVTTNAGDSRWTDFWRGRHQLRTTDTADTADTAERRP